MATWLMLGSSLWSALVVWELVDSAGDPRLSPGGGVPWLLVAIASICLVASVAALWLLRAGSVGEARLPLAIAAITGAFAVVSTVAAVIGLGLTRSRRS